MSWREQFVRSLAARNEDAVGRSLRFHFDMPESVDTYIADYLEASDDSSRIALAALGPLLMASVHSLWREVERVWPHEWPTETAMFFALLILATEHFESVSIGSDGQPSSNRYDCCGIEPQKEIGSYRVDFLVTLSRIGPDYNRPITTPSGKQLVGTKNVTKRLIVECDGHEFHEKTKEQVRRDRQRDRALQSLGMPVFRYPGSELYRDVFRCAAEALTALDLAVNAELDGLPVDVYRQEIESGGKKIVP
jgi:very-short-patch-repair endonuclease